MDEIVGPCGPVLRALAGPNSRRSCTYVSNAAPCEPRQRARFDPARPGGTAPISAPAAPPSPRPPHSPLPHAGPLHRASAGGLLTIGRALIGWRPAAGPWPSPRAIWEPIVRHLRRWNSGTRALWCYRCVGAARGGPYKAPAAATAAGVLSATSAEGVSKTHTRASPSTALSPHTQVMPSTARL